MEIKKELEITNNTGFIKVKTDLENRTWEKIHSDIVEERGSVYEPKTSIRRIRYLLMGEENKAIGIVEMLSYLPEVETNIDAYFPFSTNDTVCALRKKSHIIYEVGKLGIIPEKRNVGLLSHFVEFLFKFSLENKIDYILCAMNIEIYYYLLFNHKLAFKKLGKKVNYGPHGTYPIVIDIKASVGSAK